jgi:hypothetical protein
VQPLLQWKNNKYYILRVCVCSLRYLARIAHALYYHLWPLRYFLILSHKRHDFRNNFIEHKMCTLIFPPIVSEIFLVLARYDQKCVLVFI